MLPIGALMKEHRLIERIRETMNEEVSRIQETREVEPCIIESMVDFLHMYTDTCHHGKEEDFLFKQSAEKALSEDERRVLKELLDEHVVSRATVARLAHANQEYILGNRDAIKDILECLDELVRFYPPHIEKEEKFYFSSMEYFNDEERSDMLEMFWKYDRSLIHQKYLEVAGQLRQRRPASICVFIEPRQESPR
ncbi:MAG: hemerythrin domain-containing protein [Candidatus Abyssubacteria bacterium]